MSDIVQRLFRVLREHRFERYSLSERGYFAWWSHCAGCGFEGPRRHSNYVGWELDMRDDEYLHMLEVLLSLPGIAIVELPEPDSTRYEGDEHEPDDRLCWMPGDDFEVSTWHWGEIQRAGYGWGDLEPLSLAEARTAAANAAEQAAQ